MTLRLFFWSVVLIGFSLAASAENGTSDNHVPQDSSETKSQTCSETAQGAFVAYHLGKQTAVNAELLAKLQAAETRLQAAETRLQTAETKLQTTETALQTMETRLRAVDVASKHEQAESCSAAQADGRGSGVLATFPPSMSVYCDQKTDGGGWTVFQRRIDGSVNFYRGWDDYRRGFGTLNGEFWLGLDALHTLTSGAGQSYELRVDLEDWEGSWFYATYSGFTIASSGDNYRLDFIGFAGGNAGDGLGVHKGMQFSTPEVDNDNSGGQCAVAYRGAWWYGGCHTSNLNGEYFKGGTVTEYGNGLQWQVLKDYYYSFKTTAMKFRPQ